MVASCPTITVVAGLLQQQDTLLICQRRPDGAFPGRWEFPGGKVEPGEAPEAGLRRELQEELAIEIEVGAALYRTCHDYPGVYTVVLYFYHVRSFRGVLQNLAFAQVRWEPLAHLGQFDFLEGDAALIAHLQRGTIILP